MFITTLYVNNILHYIDIYNVKVQIRDKMGFAIVR
jgi:hypothetical protein